MAGRTRAPAAPAGARRRFRAIGQADLVLDGPLKTLHEAERNAMAERVLDMVESGLLPSPDPF